MSTSVMLPCPKCDGEIEAMLIFEPPEYDINVMGGWIVDGFLRSCDCLLTVGEEETLSAEAERVANADDQFGGPFPEPMEEAW